MSYAFLGRISRSYSELSGMFIKWGEQCEHLWVYEHPADDKVKTTHCHIFAYNSERDADGLKKLKSWIDLKIKKGNGGASFKAYSQVYDLDHELKWKGWYTCLSYASKGIHDPKLAIGENANEIAQLSKEHYVSTNNGLVVADSVEQPVKTKRVTQFQIARLAQIEYMEAYKEDFQDSRGSFRANKVLDIVKRLLRTNGMLVHDQIVTRIMQDIQADCHPEQFNSRILARFKIHGIFSGDIV